MAKPIFKDPRFQMNIPGLPEEEENLNQVPLKPASESTAEEVPDEMYDGRAASDELKLSDLSEEKRFEGTPLTAQQPLAERELPEQPESAVQREMLDPQARYNKALQAAAEAGPTEDDYTAAAIKRALAEQRVAAPAYLQQMATTLYHKPDFSGQVAAAKAGLEAPEYALTAKQQAQKRLEALAENARRQALLPGELKKQEAETSMAQMKMDALKEAARLNADKNSPASPEDIQKFRDTFGKLGADIPDSIKKGELSKAWSDVTEQAVKGKFTIQAAKIGAEAKEKTAAMGAEARKEGKDIKSKEELVKLTVPNIGVARTAEDAKELKTMAAAKENIEGGLNELQVQYKNLSEKSISSTPKILQNIGQEGKNLVMAYKEFFRLGAPQAAELKFLYSMVDSTPLEIGKNIVSDPILGTDIQSKLERLKTILNRAMNAQVSKRIRDKSELPEDLQSKFYPEQKPPTAKGSKQQKLDEIDRKMKEIEDQIKSAK